METISRENDRFGDGGIVIIGAGFGGLAVARELGGCERRVTVIDRRNHNLFQPLLYQVATAALSPADIAEPIRRTLSRYDNIDVMLAEVTGIDAREKRVRLEHGVSLPYRQLVIATGSEYNYFGNDDWRAHAPGLKTLHEARLIRQRLLLAFEKAEMAADQETRRALLTCVVIGGGPTGVEMAGAIAELGRFMIRRDFRRLQSDQLRVVLIEAGPRILPPFPEKLADYAVETLKKTGVEVMTDVAVEAVRDGAVVTKDFTLQAGCIVWGAGVEPSPAARWLGLEEAAKGRVPVNADLSVTGFPDIFAIGDTTFLADKKGKPLPALAQVAKQQGRYLGKRLRSGASGADRPFRFNNRGNTAVITRNAAIFDFDTWSLKGRPAWLLWALVHIYLLVNFEKRLLVGVQWAWRYLTRQRGARIIDETASDHVPASTEKSET